MGSMDGQGAIPFKQDDLGVTMGKPILGNPGNPHILSMKLFLSQDLMVNSDPQNSCPT